jgi:hypothetical protein
MANTPIITDVNALVSIVRGLGGHPIPAQSFQFDLPLSRVREVIPKINDCTGLGVREVSQRVEQCETRLGDAETITRLELYRR